MPYRYPDKICFLRPTLLRRPRRCLRLLPVKQHRRRRPRLATFCRLPPPLKWLPSRPVGEPDDDLSMDDIFGDDFDQPETTVIEQQETSMEELADIFGGPPTPPTGAEIKAQQKRAAVTSDEGEVSWPSEDAMPATSSNFTDDGFGVSESDAPPAPTQQSMADGVLDFIDQSASPDQAQLGDMYRIRKRSGAEIGPFDEATVLELFREGELKGNEHASIDGVNWRPLAQNPAFTEAITEAMSNAMSGFDLSSTERLTAAEENVDSANDGSRRLIALVASILLVLVGGVLAEFVTDYGWFAYRLFSGEDPNAELQQVLNEKEVLVVDLPDFKQPPLELLKPDSYPLYRAGIKDARAIKEGKKYYAKAKNYDARVALLDEDQVRPPEPKMPKDAIIAAAQMGRFASHLYLIARSDTFKREMMDALDVKQKYKVGASWLWATITATLHYTNGKIEQGIESLKSHVDPQSKLKGEGLTEVNYAWTGFGYLQKAKVRKSDPVF